MKKTFEKYLHPAIEPYVQGEMETYDGEFIYYELCGNPQGIPVLFLHGGPGGGLRPHYRRYFNQQAYNIVLFDQRGCGKSLKNSELTRNTTQNLLKDIEQLRTKLGIEKWIVFGGSWGSTLALIYAIHYPERVSALVLRGIFLARKSDIDWFYQEGVDSMKPVEFANYVSILSSEQRKNIKESYYELMQHGTPEQQKQAFIHWAQFEQLLCSAKQQKLGALTKQAYKEIREIALIENWYFHNNIFLPDNFILNNVAKIKHIPTFLVHGELDFVCRPLAAFELHQQLPNSQLFLLPKTGHALSETLMTKKLIEIMENLKTQF
ncbi:prolyl aminopeptidase [Mycoplasmopsis columbinasalis]|uniref:Proline iminopeptidase n=1 Tax=Mycoplasmopsis columbinasalis TaxID=114880 RepID=A0A449B9H9_9BACT|nr:prolyl aminopeptidase [Mycoplasmopsis columbinasalis]VEU77812.1 Proline iminopeptidase [Mycoplasmopsis columbinasalis]